MGNSCCKYDEQYNFVSLFYAKTLYNSNENLFECLICFNTLTTLTDKLVLCIRCNNVYHYKCISKWCKKIKKCPYCMYSFS